MEEIPQRSRLGSDGWTYGMWLVASYSFTIFFFSSYLSAWIERATIRLFTLHLVKIALHTANSLLTTVKMTPRARPPSAQTPPPPPPATKTRERRRRRRSFSATSILSNETAEKSHGRLVNKPPPLPATLERTERGRVGERGGDTGRKGASSSMLLAPLVPNSMDQH